MISEIETYDFFKEKLALKEEDARHFANEFVSYHNELQENLNNQVDKKFIEYQNIFATKEDIAKQRSELKQDNADLKTELKQDNADLKTELKQDNADLKTELKRDNADLKQEIANLRTELKQDNANLRTELKGEIADLRVEFRTEMKQLKIDIIRWNFIFWAALGGLIAILKFFG